MADIIGTSGNDHLEGERDRDGAGGPLLPVDDLISGLAGNDTLVADFGSDTVLGGDGDDRLWLTRGTGTYRPTKLFEKDDAADTFDGGNGNDTLDLIIGVVEWDLGMTDGFRVDVAHGSVDTGDTFSNIEAIWGSRGDDTLIGDAGTNILLGGEGNDRIVGGGGDDTVGAGWALSGSVGDDTILGGDGTDWISGGSGSDLLLGGKGDDVIHGSLVSGPRGTGFFDPTTLDGGSGNDSLVSSSMNDSLVGGGGDDTIRIDALTDFEDGTLWNAHVSGGSGFDELNVQFSRIDKIDWAAGVVVLAGDLGRINFEGIERVQGEDRPDTIPPEPPGECEVGTAGNDVFSATSKADCFDGKAGQDRVTFASSTAGVAVYLAGTPEKGFAEGDTYKRIEDLTGSAHDDTLSGDTEKNVLEGLGGKDDLLGASGNDLLKGGAQGDTLNGDAGSDRLFGQAGGDVLIGGAGGDKIYGGKGNDTLSGGKGTDILKGQGGHDTYIAEDLKDKFDGGGGKDTADFSKLDHRILLQARAPGDWGVGETPREVRASKIVLSDVEEVIGSRFSDIMFGTPGDETLDGGSGRDALSGGGGRDLLLGGGVDDIFFLGESEEERVKGQGGSDTFQFNDRKGDNRVWIHDYEFGFESSGAWHGDVLDFSAFDLTDDEFFSHVTDAGSSVKISLKGLTVRLLATDYGQFVTDVSAAGEDALLL